MSTYAVFPGQYIPGFRAQTGELAVDFPPIEENPFLFLINEVLSWSMGSWNCQFGYFMMVQGSTKKRLQTVRFVMSHFINDLKKKRKISFGNRGPHCHQLDTVIVIILPFHYKQLHWWLRIQNRNRFSALRKLKRNSPAVWYSKLTLSCATKEEGREGSFPYALI